MTDPNTIVAWIGMLAGVCTGSIAGLFFQREEWLGGYASWRRRLMRLGHIALFGIALINLAYALPVHALGWPGTRGASLALIVANFLMPLVCYLAAWRKPFRWLFALPVGCAIAGIAIPLWLTVNP